MTTAPPIGAMADLLEALPRGRRLWMTTRGRSLWPLLRGGEQLLVQRCDAHELQAGDVAVLLTPARALVAHVVVSAAPLRTAAFNGRADPGSWVALGRVIAVRIAGRAVPLPRPLVRSSQRAWSAVARLRPAQLAWTALIAVWGSSGMRRLRDVALGAVDVRIATDSDRPEVVAALSMHEVLTEDALERLLEGATIALARARGGIVGIALHDARGRLLRARTLRRAAGHGVEQRLIDALSAEGLREANISGLKPAFITSLARRGFQPRGERGQWKLHEARPTAQP